VTDEAPRAGQRRQRARPLALVPEHRHEDLRLAKILGRLHVGDRDEAQAGILELPLQEHRDLLFDELVHAIQTLALHQRISTAMSMTVPSTLPSMKFMALETTSLA